MCLCYRMDNDEPIINSDDQHDNEVEVPLTAEVNTEEEKKPTCRVRSIVWDHFSYVKGVTYKNANILTKY